MATGVKAVRNDFSSCGHDVAGYSPAARSSPLDYHVGNTVTPGTPRGVFLYISDTAPGITPSTPSGAWGSGGAFRRAKGTALQLEAIGETVGRVVELSYDPGDVISSHRADVWTVALEVTSCSVSAELPL